MPYADDDRISKGIIEGGIKISETEYNEARNHALSGGMIKVHDGKMVLTRKPEKKEGHENPSWQNGVWHHEPLPEPTQAEKDAKRLQEIDTRLRQIDVESVRPLRAINNGTAVQYDHDRLAEMDAEAETLREERVALA